jgi:hypothetical protein
MLGRADAGEKNNGEQSFNGGKNTEAAAMRQSVAL